jgi:UDP:flavonoid glycosyltransferase YjiC (YdhE family)
MIASGSRGDVEAFVALGMGLAAAGHDVTIATHEPFESLVREHGLGFFRLSGDSRSFLAGIAGIAFREKWHSPLKLISFCERFLGPFFDRFLTESYEATRNADAILYWPFLRVGPSLAEKLHIPTFGALHYPLPYQRTSALPSWFFNPWPRFEGWPWPVNRLYNTMTYTAGPLFWRIFRDRLNRWRTDTLGLAPVTPRQEARSARALPHLHGFSANVLPRPRDWPRDAYVTGYWFLDDPIGTPPAGLSDFIAAGPPPVYIGFGSMVSRNRDLTDIAIDALDRAGARGVLLGGWGALEEKKPRDSVFHVDSVSHDWLFPRMSAVVHHGGSGTTAAAVRAGVPSIVTPFGFDQTLWGRQTAKLGVGVDPLPQAKLTAANLANAIRKATHNGAMKQRASELSVKVRSENGIARAVEIFHQYAR